MAMLEADSFKIRGVITSVNSETDEIGTAYSDGMTATVLYPALAQGGISPKVGALFEARADYIEPNAIISPYGFMAV